MHHKELLRDKISRSPGNVPTLEHAAVWRHCNLTTEYKERRYMAKSNRAQISPNMKQMSCPLLNSKNFESPEGQKEFKEWKAQKVKETEKIKSV